MTRWGWLLLASGVVACGAPAPRVSPPPRERVAAASAPPAVDSPTAPVDPPAPRDDLIDELSVAPVPMGPPPAPAPPPETIGRGRGGGGVGEGTIGLGTIGPAHYSPPQHIVLGRDDPAPECDRSCRAWERPARVSAIPTSSVEIALRRRWREMAGALEACFAEARRADPCLGDRAELELVVVHGGPVAVPGAPSPWVSCALERILPMRIDAALPDEATSARISVRVTFTPAQRGWSLPGRTIVQPVSAGVCEPSGG